MISEWNDGEPAAIFETGSKLDFGQFWHCGRAHFASAARHVAEFLYGPGRGRDRQEIRRPLFFGTFRAGATPKLAKVELSRSCYFQIRITIIAWAALASFPLLAHAQLGEHAQATPHLPYPVAKAPSPTIYSIDPTSAAA